MAELDSGTIPALIRGLVQDTRELVRQDLELARADAARRRWRRDDARRRVLRHTG